MGRSVWWMEDSCRKAVGGKIREKSIIKDLKNQGKLVKLASVLNGEPEPTITFVGLTKRLHAEAHISNI